MMDKDLDTQICTKSLCDYEFEDFHHIVTNIEKVNLSMIKHAMEELIRRLYPCASGNFIYIAGKVLPVKDSELENSRNKIFNPLA